MTVDYARFVPKAGYVYVTIIPTNDAYTVIKVGGTTRDPSCRAKELAFSETMNQLDLFPESKPYVYTALYVDNVWAAEHEAHKMLEQYSLRNGSEYFRVNKLIAAQIIEKAATKVRMI